MNILRVLALFFLLFLGAFNTLLLYGKPEKDFIPLFDSDSVLDVSLVFFFDSLYSSDLSETKLYPAKFILREDSGILSMPVFISKRGHFRKAFNVCDFPPIRIHFIDKYTNKTLLEGIDKIKLVTHCQNSDTTFDQYILQEYFLYKCYNLLTERSFKVRLARIHYIDEGKTHENMSRWAFFIENPSDLAFRINGEVLNIKYIYPEATDPYYYALMSLFQFMIINQDWSVYIAHNIEFIGIYPGLKPITVPFDFDMADIIHVPYDSPLLSYRKEKKQERKFFPAKIDKKSMDRAISNVKMKRKEIENIYINNVYLADSIKNKSLKQIDDFYTILNNKALLNKNIKYKKRRK